MSCELCDLVKDREYVTRHYYSNNVITIVDCKSCITKVPEGQIMPMVVFNHHGKAADYEEREAMSVINELFKYEFIRKEATKILDHDHYHIIGARLRDG